MTFTRDALGTYPMQPIHLTIQGKHAAALLHAIASSLTPPGGETGRPKIIIYYSEKPSGVKKGAERKGKRDGNDDVRSH